MNLSSFMTPAIVLLVLVGFVLWTVRRSGLGLTSRGQGPKRMERLDQIPLGAGERLVLVRVLDEVLLVGVAPQHVGLVHRFGPVSTDLPDAAGGAARPGFSQTLQQVLDGYLGRRP